MKKETFLQKLWDTIWPLFVYVLAQNVFALIFIPMGIPILAVLLAAVCCIPFYLKLYREEKMFEVKPENLRIENTDLVAMIVSCAALALAMNNIIAVTPLPYLFTGFEKTNDIIYSESVWIQILSAGIFGCIVEELSMRGVVYLRMRKYWGKRTAMLASSFVFGIYHLNVVQMVYAFVLGMFFVWLYERYQSIWASIIGHMSANLFILLLAGSSFVSRIMNTWMGFCLITCISLLTFYYSFRWMKQTKPKPRLEFEEKAPDTLESLTKEYYVKDTKEDNG